MASPSSPRQGHDDATAEIRVKTEDGDAQADGVSHARSETAPAVQPPPTPTTGDKRSAPSSPGENTRGYEAGSRTTASDSSSMEVDAQAEAAHGHETDSTPPPAKRRTMCGICQTEPSKYKCSRCSLAYCSVPCSRIHRDNHPPDAPADEKKKPAPPPLPSSLPSKPVPPPHPFHVLDDAPELQRLFARYPTLPARLRSIYEATQPPKAAGSNGSNGGSDSRQPWKLPHHNVRGGGGRGGRGGSNNVVPFNKPWTKEMGLKQGQKALRRARVDPGEDGDAVRAYCETVTYLLARDAEGGNRGSNKTGTSGTNGNDLTSLVREELAVEANQVIKRLMDAEGRQ
ncbi:hypothetical protein SCUCBS95973_009212 [Sporothrix curviconia]|uniref:HIT-type domain-containing protein n=1 Tax=Sporothrix curviconia TaxID=1260050 RepID=A0ABP0CT01_9PEZI